jgi:MFS family permease
MLAAFFIIERRVENPVVPFGLFRLNVFTIPVIVAFFSAIAMFGAVIFVPLLYQGVLGTSATNSGQLLTPMMLAVVVTSTLTGTFMARIPRYRFLATAALLTMITGMVLLAQVGPQSSSWEVTRDIIIIGAGLGVTFPMTIAVVQAGLPKRLVGVATSQVTFWRSLGGTIGVAVLGSILANRLPGAINTRVAALHLPPQFKTAAASAQALFDPVHLAQLRASLPPAAVPAFDQVVAARRAARAATLHDRFLLAAGVAVIAVVASVFLREVPLAGRSASMESAQEKEFEPAA